MKYPWRITRSHVVYVFYFCHCKLPQAQWVRQDRFVILQFCRSENSAGINPECQQGCVPLRRLWRESVQAIGRAQLPVGAELGRQLQLVMARQVVLTSSLSNLHLLWPCFHHHAIILGPSQTLITQHNFLLKAYCLDTLANFLELLSVSYLW